MLVLPAVIVMYVIFRTTEGLDMTVKGKYLVSVTATDTGGLSTSTELGVSYRLPAIKCDLSVFAGNKAPCDNPHTPLMLQIITVDQSYKVELRFRMSQAEVENNKVNIIRYVYLDCVFISLTVQKLHLSPFLISAIHRALTAATKAVVEVVSIDTQSSEEARYVPSQILSKPPRTRTQIKHQRPVLRGISSVSTYIHGPLLSTRWCQCQVKPSCWE